MEQIYKPSQAYKTGYSDGSRDMLTKCHAWVKEHIGVQESLELLEAVGREWL